MDKYLSIITNFGCHYKCPYCIVKENNLQIPKTTLEGLRELDKTYKECGCNIISISGGGDPLHNYDKHFDWYRELFKWSREYHSKHNLCHSVPVPIEMHTSYMTDETSFPFYDCYPCCLSCKYNQGFKQDSQNRERNSKSGVCSY